MGDDLLVCPYDPGHVIHPLRMPRHLLKCRKNHPTVGLAVCPFNGFHEMPSQELRYHMQNCPDKALLDKDFDFEMLTRNSMGEEKKRIKGCTSLPVYSDRRIDLSDDEVWGDDESSSAVPSQESTRNHRHRRRRFDDESNLRLPVRDGMVARMATSNAGRGVRHQCVRSADGQQSSVEHAHASLGTSVERQQDPPERVQAWLEPSQDQRASEDEQNSVKPSFEREKNAGGTGRPSSESQPDATLAALMLGRGRVKSSCTNEPPRMPGIGRAANLMHAVRPGDTRASVVLPRVPESAASATAQAARLSLLVQSLGRGRGLMLGGSSSNR